MTEKRECPFHNCGCVYHAEEGRLCESAQRALEPTWVSEERELMERHWERVHPL